jgi:hypothetical protein
MEEVRAKIDSVLSDLQKCKVRGKLSSGEASSFWGRLGWLSSSTYGRIGRAATQCLMQRSHEEANDWNDQLEAMLEFLSAVLAEGVLPPLEFSLSPGRKVPVIVYTDASFRWLQEPGKQRVPVAILGFYVNPLSKLFRNCLKTEIESLKRISRVFERNGAFFFRYRARVREPRCSRSGRFGRSRPYESAPTSSRSQAWLFAPAQRR